MKRWWESGRGDQVESGSPPGEDRSWEFTGQSHAGERESFGDLQRGLLKYSAEHWRMRSREEATGGWRKGPLKGISITFPRTHIRIKNNSCSTSQSGKPSTLGYWVEYSEGYDLRSGNKFGLRLTLSWLTNLTHMPWKKLFPNNLTESQNETQEHWKEYKNIQRSRR